MPQLMPLCWVLSIFMVSFFIIMIMIIFYMNKNNLLYSQMNKSDNKMNWLW